MNFLLIVFGIVLIIVGFLVLTIYHGLSSFVSKSVPPTQITNSIGQTEGNVWIPVGWGLIAIGIIAFILGLLID